MNVLNDLQDLAAIAKKFKPSDEILEPFDPEYLSNESYEAPEISSEEKRFFRKVSILQNKMRSAGIRGTWMPNEQMFKVQKTLPWATTPSVMFLAIYMDTNEYAFGGWEEDLAVSGNVSVVIAEAKKWLSNNKPALR